LYVPLRLPHKAGWAVLKGVPTEFRNPTYVLKRRGRIQIARSAGVALQANGPTVVPMERKTLKSSVTEYEAEMLMTKVPRSARADMFDLNQFTATCSKTFIDEITANLRQAPCKVERDSDTRCLAPPPK